MWVLLTKSRPTRGRLKLFCEAIEYPAILDDLDFNCPWSNH